MEDDRMGGGDRTRWGDRNSYQVSWDVRAIAASSLVPDGVSVLEIGVGLGVFRGLVSERCAYLGADLVPLDESTLAIDLDLDPLPTGEFDYVVLLGVIEYLRHPDAALVKVFDAGKRVVLSYCAVRDPTSADNVAVRRSRGWINDFSHKELLEFTESLGGRLTCEVPLNDTADFVQSIFLFERPP